MIYKKIILLLLTYTTAHCSNNGILSLPKDLFNKIVETDEQISINEFSEKIHKFQSLQRNYEYSLRDLRELVNQEKDNIIEHVSSLEKIILLSRVDKAFHDRMTNFYLNPIKSSIACLSHYMKDDIYDNLKTGKKLAGGNSCDFYKMIKNVETLKYYLNNRTLIKLAGNVDVDSSILKQYLPSALLIPDHMTKHIAEQYDGLIGHIHYTHTLYWVLQSELQRTSNNIVLGTSKEMDTGSKLIHKDLNISVRFLEKKDGLYYYTINKRPNVGFFIKKDSNQSCVIS